MKRATIAATASGCGLLTLSASAFAQTTDGGFKPTSEVRSFAQLVGEGTDLKNHVPQSTARTQRK
jgi:hypothetical protein